MPGAIVSVAVPAAIASADGMDGAASIDGAAAEGSSSGSFVIAPVTTRRTKAKCAESKMSRSRRNCRFSDQAEIVIDGGTRTGGAARSSVAVPCSAPTSLTAWAGAEALATEAVPSAFSGVAAALAKAGTAVLVGRSVSVVGGGIRSYSSM